MVITVWIYIFKTNFRDFIIILTFDIDDDKELNKAQK